MRRAAALCTESTTGSTKSRGIRGCCCSMNTFMGKPVMDWAPVIRPGGLRWLRSSSRNCRIIRRQYEREFRPKWEFLPRRGEWHGFPKLQSVDWQSVAFWQGVSILCVHETHLRILHEARSDDPYLGPDPQQCRKRPDHLYDQFQCKLVDYATLHL